MVNDKIAAAASNQGDLMLRCEPDRVDTLLGEPGAQWAKMRGRPMKKGWLRIAPEGTRDDDRLAFWIEIALAYNRIVTSRGKEQEE